MSIHEAPAGLPDMASTYLAQSSTEQEVLDKDITKRLFIRILEGSMIWSNKVHHSDRAAQGFSFVHSTPPGDILNSREPL